MQYGQRKLQRSITEIRRSWMGRRSASTGARPAVSGMTVASRLIASPGKEPGNVSLRIRVRARRQLDEPIGAGERGEIAGAVREPRLGGGAAPVVAPELHR